MLSRFDFKRRALICKKLLTKNSFFSCTSSITHPLCEGARKAYEITEGKIIKEPELIMFFVKLTRLSH